MTLLLGDVQTAASRAGAKLTKVLNTKPASAAFDAVDPASLANLRPQPKRPQTQIQITCPIFLVESRVLSWIDFKNPYTSEPSTGPFFLSCQAILRPHSSTRVSEAHLAQTRPARARDDFFSP